MRFGLREPVWTGSWQARQTLGVIFYERNTHNLATTIISNLSPDEIEKG